MFRGRRLDQRLARRSHWVMVSLRLADTAWVERSTQHRIIVFPVIQHRKRCFDTVSQRCMFSLCEQLRWSTQKQSCKMVLLTGRAYYINQWRPAHSSSLSKTLSSTRTGLDHTYHKMNSGINSPTASKEGISPKRRSVLHTLPFPDAKKCTDFVIRCGDDEHHVHREILRSSSEYFAAALDGNFRVSQQSSLSVLSNANVRQRRRAELESSSCTITIRP